MGIASDLNGIKTVSDTLTNNKVSRFAYTQEAYTANHANGTASYDPNQDNNIPLGTASNMKVNQTVIELGWRARASSITRMLMNHFLGRISYNLNKANDMINELLTKLIASLGIADGIATLDSNGRIPYSQLPESAVELKGYWNASTNTPALVDGTGTNGDEYYVDVAGTQDLGSGEQYFAVGDRVLYLDGVWRNISGASVRSVDNVSPNAQGNVSLPKSNVAVADGNDTIFSAKGAYDYFANCTTKDSWLGKVFGWALGKVWTQGTGYSSSNFRIVYYANGIWVAGNGSAHGIWWSTDGKSWTQGTGDNITNNTVYTVYYANDIWVAGTYSAGLWWSTDGKNWTQETGDSTTYRFLSIYYADGIWVAGSSGHSIWWSTDGKNWTQGTGDNSLRIETIYYANGIWVAGAYNGGIWWSTDGKNWTQGTGIGTGYTINTVYYANGIWVTGTDAHFLWWSTDGKNWTKGTGSNTDYAFNTVYYDNGIWVAGSYAYGLWWSTDGKKWTQGTGSNTEYTFNTVYYANGIWVAGSNTYGLWWSTDGKIWTQGTGGSTNHITSVYCANGIWVAATYNNGLWWSGFDNAVIQ